MYLTEWLPLILTGLGLVAAASVAIALMMGGSDLEHDYKKFQKLLQAGRFPEARRKLASLPAPISAHAERLLSIYETLAKVNGSDLMPEIEEQRVRTFEELRQVLSEEVT